MVELNVLAILEERRKSIYWLHRQVGIYKQKGMGYQNFRNMISNQTKSIRLENIDALCQILECTPNELFRFTE